MIDAMTKVDRANYVIDRNPYDDRPHYIGMGQTISAPHMHGYALQNLAPAIMVNMSFLYIVVVTRFFRCSYYFRLNLNY